MLVFFALGLSPLPPSISRYIKSFIYVSSSFPNRHLSNTYHSAWNPSSSIQLQSNICDNDKVSTDGFSAEGATHPALQVYIRVLNPSRPSLLGEEYSKRGSFLVHDR
ncbi:hypothetical protein VN97_g5380 [Penicillium thymicola]|uniref:Uncharacterized protein n=1 Tax=Penicillium thymicola TaxID=293382 RepID=A0AAI9TIX9_PENTH|nr:hypothetical protein VN97_g5380 [Penicillium thymicola]